jgi:tRNA-splicing ligase RtcB (3'-phosphate/5'-hydroxy nucleic acid ligase)
LGKGRGKGWSLNKLKLAVLDGAGFAVNEGFGHKTDLDFIEERGRISTANTETISRHAYDRGAAQLGTLGSGNHFIEIQHVDQIFEPEVAKAFGLRKGQVVILIHTGSRGFGHQVCTDHLQMMKKAMVKYQIHVEDRQLACVPIDSKEGEDYLSAMAGAANFAFANRQFITHYVRQAFNSVMGKANMDIVYDVAHNIAKKEDHLIEGKKQPVLVHRKGATRAFPKGHKDLPIAYQSVGQPVLIPGSMGTASYVLVGKELAMEETFGSVCHGAGRVMSRKASKKNTSVEEVVQSLQNKGILIQSASKAGITEEQPEAYKDVDEVVSIVHNAGLASMVARLKPIAVIKG